MSSSSSQLKSMARTVLERDGLMLLTDQVFPSLVALVAGGPIKGSWWGHPKGKEIYSLSNGLADDDDVAMIKLVSGKITFVHAHLWPALLGACGQLQPWQKDDLTKEGEALLEALRKAGRLRTDELSPAKAKLAKALEERLVFKSGQIHTESGAHATVLSTWESWAMERGVLPSAWLAPDAGRATLEGVVAALNERSGASGKLPWQAR